MRHKTPAEKSRDWKLTHRIRCKECGKESYDKGKGLCPTCYNRQWRKTTEGKRSLKKYNDAHNPNRKLWGSKLWHELSDLPCSICGWKEASRDVHHIIPRSKGGPDTRENLITLCPNHHRMAEEGLLKL